MNTPEQSELRTLVMAVTNIDAPSDVDTHILNHPLVMSSLNYKQREAIKGLIDIFLSCRFNNDGRMHRRMQTEFERAGVKVNGPSYPNDASGVTYHLEIATSEDQCLPDSYGHHIIRIDVDFNQPW